jgi:hypothetical protein
MRLPDGRCHDEHSGARWVDAQQYRDRYFNENVVALVDEQNARLGSLMRAVRDNIDHYLSWRDHEFLDKQLREMRLSADVFVLRGGKMLLLKRMGHRRGVVPAGRHVEPARTCAIRPSETFEERACASRRRSCCASGTTLRRMASTRSTHHLRRSVPRVTSCSATSTAPSAG